VLVVSEVVTNAVQHGAGVVRLRLLRRRTYVRVEVEDGSPTLPMLLARAGGAAEQGRGLEIVRKLAARWGSQRSGAGKLVWAELPAGVDFGVDELPTAGRRLRPHLRPVKPRRRRRPAPPGQPEPAGATRLRKLGSAATAAIASARLRTSSLRKTFFR